MICDDCKHKDVCSYKEKCNILENSVSDTKIDDIIKLTVSCKYKDTGVTFRGVYGVNSPFSMVD